MRMRELMFSLREFFWRCCTRSRRNKPRGLPLGCEMPENIGSPKNLRDTHEGRRGTTDREQDGKRKRENGRRKRRRKTVSRRKCNERARARERVGQPLSASRGTWPPVRVENDTGYKRRIRKFRGAMKNATAELSSTWIFHRCESSPGRESYSRDSPSSPSSSSPLRSFPVPPPRVHFRPAKRM